MTAMALRQTINLGPGDVNENILLRGLRESRHYQIIIKLVDDDSHSAKSSISVSFKWRKKMHVYI